MKKKKILICIDWYLPGYKAGGPIRSVANIVNQFKDEFEFHLLTSAYDLEETEVYENVALNTWESYDGIAIKYLDSSQFNKAEVDKSIAEVMPDTIYLNSLFSKVFAIYPLLYAKKNNIKTILAPRGMLGEGALNIKRHKKQLFLILSRFFRLYKNVVWHASTHLEEKEIVSNFGAKAKVVVAQNLPGSQKYTLEEIERLKQNAKVRYVFISRVSLKKNLHLAVEALNKVGSANEKKIEFDIYGTIEDAKYFESIKAHFGDNENVSIRYRGILKPDEIAEVYAKANFMLLPTSHENFGHAIVEAWSNGCPVIISDNTPWQELKEKKLGWSVRIHDKNNYYAAIKESLDLEPDKYREMVVSSYNFFKKEICREEIVNDNRQLFY